METELKKHNGSFVVEGAPDSSEIKLSNIYITQSVREAETQIDPQVEQSINDIKYLIECYKNDSSGPNKEKESKDLFTNIDKKLTAGQKKMLFSSDSVQSSFKILLEINPELLDFFAKYAPQQTTEAVLNSQELTLTRLLHDLSTGNILDDPIFKNADQEKMKVFLLQYKKDIMNNLDHKLKKIIEGSDYPIRNGSENSKEIRQKNKQTAIEFEVFLERYLGGYDTDKYLRPTMYE